MDDIPIYLTIAFVLFFISVIVFNITFLVNWRRLRHYVGPYLKYGIGVAVFCTVLSVIEFYIPFPTYMELMTEDPIWSIGQIFNLVFDFFVLIAVTIVGLHFAKLLNFPQLPILAPNIKATNFSNDLPSESSLPEKVSVSHKELLFAVFTVAIAGAIVQGVLFRFISLDISTYAHLPDTLLNEIKPLFQYLESGKTPWFTSIHSIVYGALFYEIIFRFGVQNSLSVWWGESELAKWLAIAVSAILSASVFLFFAPVWAGFTAALLFNLGLGWLNKRYGIEACVLASFICSSILAVFGLWMFVI